MEQENRWQEIKAIVSTLRQGNQRRYPSEISDQIGQFAKEQVLKGMTKSHIAKELGTCTSTLNRMMGIESSAKVDNLRFKPVRVGRGESSQGKICLPGGISIVGLSLDELVIVARGLSK